MLFLTLTTSKDTSIAFYTFTYVLREEFSMLSDSLYRVKVLEMLEQTALKTGGDWRVLLW